MHQYDCHSNSVASGRDCFTKKTRHKSSDCSAEVIRRSSWPIHYCLEKSNHTHTHTHTHVHVSGCVHVGVHVSGCVHVSGWVHVGVCVHVWVCMWVWVCM